MLPKISIHTTEEDVKYILFDQQEIISDVIREQGFWSKPNLQLAHKVLSKQLPGVILDIGAGLGSFSIPLGLDFKNKFEIHCFEPLPVIFLQLCSNTLINLLSKLTPHNIAISNNNCFVQATTLDIERSQNHGSFSLLEEINQARGIAFSPETATYECRTIDSFNFKNVKLIKITVCGMEKEVLEGCKRTIAENNNPPILMELWDEVWHEQRAEATKKLLDEMNYKFLFKQNGYVFAFVDEENANFLLSDGVINEATGFIEAEDENDSEKTLENQSVYTPIKN